VSVVILTKEYLSIYIYLLTYSNYLPSGYLGVSRLGTAILTKGYLSTLSAVILTTEYLSTMPSWLKDIYPVYKFIYLHLPSGHLGVSRLGTAILTKGYLSTMGTAILV
jgi:hypothetical protein